MKYKSIKYKDYLRRKSLDTYEPEQKFDISKERAVPLFLRIGNHFIFLGGVIGFFISSFILSVKGILGVKEKIKETSNYRITKYEPWMPYLEEKS